MPDAFALSPKSARDFQEMRAKVLGARERNPVFSPAAPIDDPAPSQDKLLLISSSVTDCLGWYNAKTSTGTPDVESVIGPLVDLDISTGWSETEDVLVQYVPDLDAGVPSITDFTSWNYRNLIKLCHRNGTDAATGKPIYIYTGGGGNTITRVRVAGDLSGGGKYSGYLVDAPTSELSATGNLADSDLGANGTAVYIFNAAEAGQSTHDLTAGTPVQKTFLAIYLGLADDDTPVYQINGFDPGSCE